MLNYNRLLYCGARLTIRVSGQHPDPSQYIWYIRGDNFGNPTPYQFVSQALWDWCVANQNSPRYHRYAQTIGRALQQPPINYDYIVDILTQLGNDDYNLFNEILLQVQNRRY